jgi:hypothetical protein
MATQNKQGKIEPLAEGSLTPETEGKFNSYCEKVISPEATAAKSAAKVKTTAYWQKKVNLNYKTCFLNRADAAVDEYGRIANRITTWLGQSSVELQANIASYIAAGVEMDKTLMTAVQAVKDTKSRLKTVKEVACKLENCMLDSCNSEQLKILSKGFKAADSVFSEEIAEIMAEVDSANQNGYKVFESGVKVVGIARFINLPSLKEQGDSLKTLIDKLTANVADNIAFSAAEKEKVQKNMTTAIQDLVKALHQRDLADLKEKALEATCAFSDAPQYLGGQTLEEICDKVESSFGKCDPVEEKPSNGGAQPGGLTSQKD